MQSLAGAQFWNTSEIYKKTTRIQKNIEKLDLKSGVGKREIDADNAGEKVDIISYDLDYIDEDSSEVQLQVETWSSE